MKNWLFLLPLAYLMSCDTENPQNQAFCGFGEEVKARYIGTGYCPDGYLFEWNDGSRVFVDYTAYRSTHAVSDSVFSGLKKGDKVCMSYETYPEGEDMYWLVDLFCQANVPQPEYDLRIRLLSFRVP